MIDVRAAFDGGGTDLVRPARPAITCNGRQHDDVVADALDALAAGNDPPLLFVRSGQLVRLRTDEEGRPLIEALRADHVRLHLAQAATWWRATKDGVHTAVGPPIDVCASILASHDWTMPPLAGVVELPVLRPDGTLHTDHGYDDTTRLYHWHARGFTMPAVPDQPNDEQLATAVALIDETLCDFPWDTTADRANAWGLLLTPLVRPLVGQVPMALVDAPEPGTGKGLLVKIAAFVTIGRPAALMAWPASDEELEKKVTAALMAGNTMVIWDNVEGMIRSPTLAAVLTADAWQGRVLGRSEMVAVPNRATWVATGNNIDVGGDLARRCYRIRLDARQATPWQRTGFLHPDLEDWVLARRGDLLAALCTIVRSWWTAGRPLAEALPAMGGYTSWVRTVGGILAHAGIDGFLANLADFHAQADREAQQWEAFLSTWADEWGEGGLTVAELIATMAGGSMAGNALKETIPEDLSGYWDMAGFSRRLGHALRKRVGRHYGPDGIHLIELARDRAKVAVYAVTDRPVRLFETADAFSSDQQPAAPDARGLDGSAGCSAQHPARLNATTRDDDLGARVRGFFPNPSRDENGRTYVQKPGGATAAQEPANPANPRDDDSTHLF